MSPKSHPLIHEFKAITQELERIDPKSKERIYPPAVTAMRGNRRAQILLLAPSPKAQDIVQNLPLSNSQDAQTFHEFLEKETGLSTEEHMLVMCGTPFEKKATKSAVELLRKVVLKHGSSFKLVICMGGDNFKFYFGDGKKSALSTLASGTLIYMPNKIGSTPLFVLPDVNNLAPEWTNDRNIDWKLQLDKEKCEKWLLTCFAALTRHVKALDITL